MNRFEKRLIELVEADDIDTSKFFGWLKKKNKSMLIKLLKSKFDFSMKELDLFLAKIFRSWTNIDTIFKEEESLMIQYLINNCGVISLTNFICKSKLTRHRTDIAIKGLIEIEYIEILRFENENIIYLNKEEVRKVIKK